MACVDCAPGVALDGGSAQIKHCIVRTAGETHMGFRGIPILTFLALFREFWRPSD